MTKNESYERYPASIIAYATIVSFVTYASGTLIMSKLSLVSAAAYMILIGWLEYRVLHRSCAQCYYYGKGCAFGRGWLCGKLIRQGNPESFANRTLSWRDAIPDFMVFIIPFIAGVYVIFTSFSWLIVALIVLMILFFFVGAALIRGRFACRYCRQREIGCPAERLFNKNR